MAEQQTPPKKVKYTLARETRIGDAVVPKGKTVELYPDQVERLKRQEQPAPAEEKN